MSHYYSFALINITITFRLNHTWISPSLNWQPLNPFIYNLERFQNNLHFLDDVSSKLCIIGVLECTRNCDSVWTWTNCVDRCSLEQPQSLTWHWKMLYAGEPPTHIQDGIVDIYGDWYCWGCLEWYVGCVTWVGWVHACVYLHCSRFVCVYYIY